MVDSGTSLDVLHVHDDVAFEETQLFIRRITQGKIWAVK